MTRLRAHGRVGPHRPGPGHRPYPASRPVHLVLGADEDEQPLEWVVQRHPRYPDRTRGLFHLKGGWPGLTTLCGMEKGCWRSWPPSSGRPPVEMCCRRCMAVATKRILEDKVDGRR